MKLFQLLPKKLYDFACNLPSVQALWTCARCSPFSGVASGAPLWTPKGFDPDHYRVSTPTPIGIDLGPL